jgi:hypothetical protein
MRWPKESALDAAFVIGGSPTNKTILRAKLKDQPAVQQLDALRLVLREFEKALRRDIAIYPAARIVRRPSPT